MNFQGDTLSCLRHLHGTIKDDDDFFEKRAYIAKFAGVGERAVYNWFRERNPPVGAPLIRLRYYLEFCGYTVEDFPNLDPDIRQSGKLIAFGVLTVEEMAEAVGYPGDRAGADAVLKVFRGVQGTSHNKLLQFQTLVELYKDQLDEKIQSTRCVVPKRSVEASQPKPLPVRAPLRVVARPVLSEHEALICSFANMVTAMLPLARLVSSDDFSPEDRAKVRELSGHEGVFELANTLFRICGERSRAMRQQ
jgi:hypothetical protein